MFGSNPLATSPYTPFLARLSSVSSGSGGLTGWNVYQWVETSAFTSAGVPTDSNPARKGTSVSGYALEANNQLLTVPYVSSPTSPAAVLAAGGTLTVAQTYYYKITATFAAGESLPSLEVSATPTSGNQTIKLTWTAPANASGYRIYRGTSAGAENLLVGTVSSGSTTTFSDTGFVGASATLPTSNTTGPYAWLRLKGVVQGIPIYEFEAPNLGATSLTVTDGTTSVVPVTKLKFTSGATVTNAGGGEADVAVSGGGFGGGGAVLLGADFVMTINNLVQTITTTGFTMTLANAGTYLLFAQVTATMQVSTYSPPQYIQAAFAFSPAPSTNRTGPAVITHPSATSLGNNNPTQSGALFGAVTVTGSTTVTMQVQINGSNATTATIIGAGDASGLATTMGNTRIA